MELNLIIPVYKRLHTLKRLVESIEVAERTSVLNLTISCDGGASSDVLEWVKNLQWRHGSYTVMDHQENLGVDKHNIWCIAQAKKMGHVLVLEDDLIVSPLFIKYIDAARGGLENEPLAGIALYRYAFNEQSHFPFELIPNDEFVYYQQRACSKGCYYSGQMADAYLSFLDTFDYKFERFHLPSNVLKWSDEVWEKSFYCFLQESQSYLAFPRHSLSTDFGDAGVHMQKESERYVHQTALYLKGGFQISSLDSTYNVYDAFYELHPAKLKELNPELSEFDLEVDIYGYKDKSKVGADYLVSENICDHPIKSWGAQLKPEINNVILNNVGTHYSLGHKAEFKPRKFSKKRKHQYFYYYPDTKLVDLILMKLEEIKSRFIS